MDWDRFATYAARVHFLTYDDNKKFKGRTARIAPDLIGNILLYRPGDSSPMLPNLKTIKWTTRHDDSLLQLLPFVPSTVYAIDINWRGANPGSCAKTLRGLLARKLTLSIFRFAAVTVDEEGHRSLSAFLRGQRKLEQVALPPFSATTEVVEALSGLRALKTYELYTMNIFVKPVDSGMQFDWRGGAFKSLETLGYYAPVDAVMRVFAKTPRPALRQLSLRVTTYVGQDDLELLTRAISSTFPNITRLYLALYAELGEDDGTMDAAGMRPLFACSNLMTFMLRDRIPISLGEADIAAMAKAWPHLQQLGLCADPVCQIELEAGLPIAMLDKFAKHFVELCWLFIYVNGTDEPVISNNQHTFAKLHYISFGTSPSLPTKQAAQFLSRILPIGTTVTSGKSQQHKEALKTRADAEKEYGRRGEAWAEIASTVALIHAEKKSLTDEKKAWVSEKAEISSANRALEEKVERLEAMLAKVVSLI